MQVEPALWDDSAEVSVVVTEDAKYRLRKEALERSEPGDEVTMSDIMREALVEHFEGD